MIDDGLAGTFARAQELMKDLDGEIAAVLEVGIDACERRLHHFANFRIVVDADDADLIGNAQMDELAKAMRVKVTALGPRRTLLIRKGMIYSPAYGEIAFTVPMFAEFLRRNPRI